MANRLRSRHEVRTPWADAEGWEYDLLRTLPLERASEAWSRALSIGARQALATWRTWALLIGIGVNLSIVTAGVLVAAAALGFGQLGALLLEVIVVHVVFLRVLSPAFARQLPELLRPFVRQQLMQITKTLVTSLQPEEHE